MTAAPKVGDVEAHPDHTLTLKFANSEIRVFDVKPYLDTPVVAALKNPDLFELRAPLMLVASMNP